MKAEGRAALRCLLVHTSAQFAYTTAGAPKQQTPTMPAPAALLFLELSFPGPTCGALPFSDVGRKRPGLEETGQVPS